MWESFARGNEKTVGNNKTIESTDPGLTDTKNAGKEQAVGDSGRKKENSRFTEPFFD